jgi:GntR family transcriptional regulator
MLLSLSDRADEPLQGQIVRQIRARILSGELEAGTRLPSIRRLAQGHKVSVITVQRGYEVLEREGLIHSRRGKGFFVSALGGRKKKGMARKRLEESIRPAVEEALSQGMKPREILTAIEASLPGLDSRAPTGE